MLRIRTMTVDDVAVGLRLKAQAGWNQLESDWRRIQSLQPEGCFVAELDGHPVGTTCTCAFDQIGWIAMVLVDESARGRGIGKQLMQHALAYLDRSGMRTVRLDATPLGRPLYEKLGFVVDYELNRWEGIAHGGQTDARIVPIDPERLELLCDLDREATGTNRRRLLQRLYQERPDAMRVFTDGSQVAGYLSSRLGARAAHIGPVVASSPTAGSALLDAALGSCAGQPVFCDIPVDNLPAVQWAQSSGLQVQRLLTRMHRGEPIHDRPTQQWACFGPEKG